MRARIGILGAMALAAGAVNAQPYAYARTLSTEFLTRLARQSVASSQVAIINASVGSMIIFDRDESAAIVHIDHGDRFVWSRIAEQLPEAVKEGKPMQLSIQHRSVDASLCPDVTDRLTEFRRQLASFDPHSRRTAIPELQEIVVDATAFLIVMPAPDAVVTIAPNGALDPPLQQAAGRLHSAVSRCAVSVTPRVQQYFF